MNRFWKSFRKNKLAVSGAVIIMVLAVLAIFAPFIAPYNPDKPDLVAFKGIPQPPSRQHLLGTDNYGRDLFSRALFGARISLSVGIVAVLIFIFIGTFLGAISGFFGGIVDTIIMRLVDVMLCLPTFFFILIIQSLLRDRTFEIFGFSFTLGPSIYNVMLVIGLTSWAGTARLVRGQILKLKEMPFVEAARAIGLPSSKIITRYLIPNTMGAIIVTATLGIASTILTESVLSFLGLGVQEPQASWGNMLQRAQEYMFTAPWMAIYPGLLIMITVLALNFAGDGLRDALDPKMKI